MEGKNKNGKPNAARLCRIGRRRFGNIIEQDIKVTEIKKGIYFIVFQNRAHSDPPIPDRSVVYFGLGIGHAKGKPANQIWLLAETVPSVMHGKLFTRYILKDEVTGKNHPENSSIMFIDLEKLSEENSQAGELAALFLGKNLNPQDEDVKTIAAALKASFNDFKDDKSHRYENPFCDFHSFLKNCTKVSPLILFAYCVSLN
ncbi:MAG: hypothetical protein LBI27_07850 [Clostridiales bacterium]|nr:hypothetical protein [Clostridiales bacterium]